MPKREVLQPEDLPRAILFDILILVDTSFPPLYKAARVCVLDALVGTGGHHASEATFSAGALRIDVYDTLDLRMVEKEAMYRAITAIDERFGEAANIQALDTLLAIVAAAEELNAGVGMVRI